jgi:hypothetical protein
MRATDHHTFQSFSTVTQGPFLLVGGMYAAFFKATSWGTMQFNVLGPNGSTFVPADAVWSANGTSILRLPPGQYQVVPTTVSGGYVSIRRVPMD